MTDITEEMLHAFVDGQLDDIDMARVETYLNDNPERAAEIDDWQNQNASIRALYPVPEISELPKIAIPTAANYNRLPLRAIVASVLFFGVGIAAGWIGRGQTINPKNTEFQIAGLVEQAISAHMVYTADTNRPVEVTANEEDLLIRWLSNRVGKQLSAPDLTANGFDLVGGRLLAASDEPAAQFMYENANGVRITLFAVRSQNTHLAEFTFKKKGKINSFYWQDENLRYALVGAVSRDDLNALAVRVFQAYS